MSKLYISRAEIKFRLLEETQQDTAMEGEIKNELPPTQVEDEDMVDQENVPEENGPRRSGRLRKVRQKIKKFQKRF